jgi:protein-disulfide isomerase
MKPKKSMSLWVGVVVVLIAILGILSYVVKNSPPSGPSDGQDISNDARPDDHVVGSGSVALIEYADYQCPACAAYYPLVKKLMEDKSLDGKVKFIYRNFPLFQTHKNANYAAYAAEAAALQGKFWEMHDVLYERQTDWAERVDAKTIFAGYAKTIGLDEGRFVKDFDSDAIHNRVSGEYSEAVRLGLRGTPTFFLNGKKIDNPRNYEDLLSLVQKSIQ